MSSHTGEITPRRTLDGLEMFLVRQRWEQPVVTDIAGTVASELERTGALARLHPGDEIAITAGSRGIAAIPEVLHAVIAQVRAHGGVPFLFPAMGSHGGGTAEGQRALLESLGITEQTMGVPIRASMEVVKLGETSAGIGIYQDAIAARAVGVILVNRIKKHTNFDAAVESGLCKMAVIGMGKHTQAAAVHQFGNRALQEDIYPIARTVLEKANVIAGLAILEGATGQVAELHGLRPDEIPLREPALLRRSKELCAKLPFAAVDIALVEWMGKEISGTGMDCYVIGRKRIIGEPEWPEAIRISSLIVLDLTPASHGNGLGVGLADFTTRRLADKIDWPITRANILTSGNLERGKLPLTFESDREALEASAFRERIKPLETLRVVALRDTLHLRHLLVSRALLEGAVSHEGMEIVRGPLALPFDAQGMWCSPLSDL